MLTINNLIYRIGNRTLFDGAGLTVMDGWRVGIVGPNGAGKTTLFKLIAGDIAPDGGEVQLSSRRSFGMVRQDVPSDSTPILDVVLSADKERAALMHAADTEQDAFKLADIHTRLNDIDAYSAPARASAILSGLGFTQKQLSDPISSLSGGWRMRVALASALFQQPEVLLLDEPTNHLDIEATMWLENYLATYPHTLLVISHDRGLLNLVCDRIVHVENQSLTLYTGNYDTFERERAEKLNRQQALFEKQQAQRAHMQAFVDRFRYKASKARQAQSRLKALEKMDLVDAVMADRATAFNFPQPETLPPPLIVLDEVNVGYGDKTILRGLNERLDMDDRIALLGANGNGKSTLIKLFAGELTPQKGSFNASNKLRVGYFAQHQTELLDVTQTPYNAMAQLMEGAREPAVRARLGQFGFDKNKADTKIGNLSGGEKARLLFALMTHAAPHLLLLDEPTNHLDMDAREALVKAINNYSGAVIIVSHDPGVVARVADRLWLVEEGRCKTFDGDIDAYRAHVLEGRRTQKGENKKTAARQASRQTQSNVQSNVVEAVFTKPDPMPEGKKRKQFADLYKAVQQAERHMNKLHDKKLELEDQLADTTLYASPDAVHDIQFSYGQLLKDIAAAEETWMEAQEAYDQAG